MINDPAKQSEARQPRGIVRVSAEDADGKIVTAESLPWVEWEVNNNRFAQADTFRVSFAVSLLPASRSADWFGAQNRITVEIFAGFPADPESYTVDDLQSLIYGIADDMTYDPVSRTIELTGRDLTALLVDSITLEQWKNKTASEVAQIIATRHGLKTDYIKATTTKIGDYYRIEHASLSDQKSEWDILNWAAGLEQFAVFVSGQFLHFEPAPQANDNPYALKFEQVDDGYYSYNGKRLSFSRNLALSSGIHVTVNSFNYKTGKKVSRSYPEKPRKNAQKYIRRYANMDDKKALQKAQEIYREVMLHEMRLQAEMPADNILTASNVISVSGTGTAYDQIYYPDSITRRMGMGEGYTMTVTAKNHSPENQSE